MAIKWKRVEIMVKLMFIHHSGLVGGAGVSLINVIKGLSKKYEIEVCVPPQPDDMIKLLKREQKNYHFNIRTFEKRIGAITYYSGGDRIRSLRLWYRGALIVRQWNVWNKRIREIKPDIIIVNSKILCWMSMLQEVRKRKSICFVRETMKGEKSNWVNRIISKLLLNFGKVIFLSDYDALKEGICPEKTEVIHNYIEESQFDLSISREEASEKLGIKKDTFHVLYVGGVSQMKGFDLAVEAVLKSGENVELIVAGNDFEDVLKTRSNKSKRYAEEWKQVLNEKDIGGQIHMVGKQKNMSLCYAACDVLVFPMRSPHQSRPVFEAGYYMKPVIITDFPNITEFVEDGYNGYIVCPENKDVIAEKIVLLKENCELRDRMGKSNKINTEEKHNQKRSMDLIYGIIEEISLL